MVNKDVLSRNILLLDSIREVAKVCIPLNIDILLLKGAALLELGIYEFSEREMTDVDVLIKPERLSAFEKILIGMGFELMKNSSQAFIKVLDKNIPPVIIDVHVNLRHIKNTSVLWENAHCVKGTLLFLPCPEDQFLHLIAHPVLHHGFVDKKAKSDIKKFLVWINKTSDINSFWNGLTKKSRDYGLNPVIYPVFEALGKSNPDLIPSDKIALFYPENFEKIKAYFFKKTLNKHSNFFEYFLPVLYKPSLAFKFIFPSDEFLKRRYGKTGLLITLTRPFKLLKKVI